MHLHASEFVIVWQQEPWVKNYIRTKGGKEETDMQKGSRNDRDQGLLRGLTGTMWRKEWRLNRANHWTGGC